jgi:putative glycosyltransferase (TIGR04372 family)
MRKSIDKIARVFAILFGRPVVYIALLLSKSQVSSSLLVRVCGYPFFKIVDTLMGANIHRLIAYLSRRSQLLRRGASIKNSTLSAVCTLVIAKSPNLTGLYFDPLAFRSALVEEDLNADYQNELAHQLYQAGNLVLACEAFKDLVDRSANKLPPERRLQLLRDTGIVFFLHGKIEQANDYWARAGHLRRLILGDESGPIYRILSGSWFAAIGHVAMLDYYLKYNQLYRQGQVRLVVQQDISKVPGNYLCERLTEAGLEFIEHDQLEADYDQWAKERGKSRRWCQLTKADRFALIDDFWEFEFPDGQVLGYTHAADRIQKDWEKQKRSPLLTISDGEKTFLYQVLRTLGLPEGAWYICLHVREAGFHKNWNSLYPSMRDANIDDYLPAIKLIIESGGWVIRMGDSSMKPLPPIEGVIDYAHSNFKTPTADIIISLGCRFFLGTNSGFATIPATYGVRCIFSNWMPIGLPLWPSQDLMLPKMFWNEKEERYLALKEVFSSGLAFIQNWSDLPEGIRLLDNTPEEIRELTAEALNIDTIDLDSEIVSARRNYSLIARQHGSYVGSNLASFFIKRHQSFFSNR